MTNRDMVKGGGPGKGSGPKPAPNPVRGAVMPAPESDAAVYTTEEPMDSPQPKPNIKQDKSKGLKR